MSLASQVVLLAQKIGADVKAIRGAIPALRVSTADVSSASTTPVTITGLTWTGLAAGSYVLEIVLLAKTTATLGGGGPRYSFTGNADLAMAGSIEVTTSTTARTTAVITAPGTAVGANPGAANTYLPVTIRAVLVLPTAGSFTARLASSDALSTATVQKNAYGHLQKV